MYEPNFYKEINEAQVVEDIKKSGFNPYKFNDPPGKIYPEHSHPETKLLVFLAGSMEVRVGGKKYQCGAGDKMIIPGNTLHAAVVNKEGCTFFWSEKILRGSTS